MQDIVRLVDCIEKLTRLAETRSAEGRLLVKEIESRDWLLGELREKEQALLSSLSCQEMELETLRRQQASLKAQLQAAKLQIEETNELLQIKTSEAVTHFDLAVDLNKKLVSKQAELLALSDRASRIEHAPMSYFLRKHFYKRLRSIYAQLPLKPALKSKLAYRVRRWLKISEATLPAQSTTFNKLGGESVFVRLQLRSSATQPVVLMFGIIDWHFRIQRPQNLAKELAKAGQRTLYISNHFIDDDAPGFDVEELDQTNGLFQIRLNVSGAPAIYHAPPSADAISQLCQSLALLLEWANIGATHCIVQHAYWFPVARRVPDSTLVYDCMDYHEGFGNVTREMLDLEIALMRRADLLVASSDWIERHGKRENPNVKLIRNASEYSVFSQRPDSIFQDALGRRIIGYYGAIAEWFDLNLIKQVAEALPQHLILLIGNDTINARKSLKAHPNIVMQGEVPYASLPYYLHAMDVCLLPFKVVPLTLATNPVKVYEYLSAGKPVVAVKLPELSQFGDLVNTAENAADFVLAVHAALKALPEPESAFQARQLFAQGQTWQHRTLSLREAIDMLPVPKISVVVLTYNNLDLSKACLDSLVMQSNYANLEIIVVDNHSSDETPTFLRMWAEGYPNRIVILNPDNKGFAAGNNVGLAAASGDYLVILNNDTVVTAGWAKGLMRHLRDNEDIGIIGPITNNIGNEARVDTRYTEIKDMPAEVAGMTRARMGEWFEINTLAFFCVMFSRSTYEKVGGLCEEYGLGFFEDDDYCRRVQQSGMRAACAEDVFVHHHLSASFNKLGVEKKQALFEKNKAIYEAKWGTWSPHTYRDVWASDMHRKRK